MTVQKKGIRMEWLGLLLPYIVMEAIEIGIIIYFIKRFIKK